MVEKHILVRDSDNVIVKRARINRLRRLPREHGPLHAMPPGDGLASFKRLARRKIRSARRPAARPYTKHLHPGRAWRSRPCACDWPRPRRTAHHARATPHARQSAPRPAASAASVRSVCSASSERCNMVCRLATEACRRPSAQSALGEIVAAFAAHIAEAEAAARAMFGALSQARAHTSRVRSSKAKRAQPCDIGPLVRRQNALLQAKRRQPAHLGDALQRRFARPRDHVAIARRGKIAFGKPSIIVRRAD